jgi:hypothetical protein
VIASYLGSQCSPILQPLLQQGLSDAEETIIYKTIMSISSLVEQGFNQLINFDLFSNFPFNQSIRSLILFFF